MGPPAALRGLRERGEVVPVEVEGSRAAGWSSRVTCPRSRGPAGAGRGPRARRCCRPSIPCSGTASAWSGSSDFELPDRGLHAGAEAGPRLLHPADPPRRPAHRPAWTPRPTGPRDVSACGASTSSGGSPPPAAPAGGDLGSDLDPDGRWPAWPRRCGRWPASPAPTASTWDASVPARLRAPLARALRTARAAAEATPAAAPAPPAVEAPASPP